MILAGCVRGPPANVEVTILHFKKPNGGVFSVLRHPRGSHRLSTFPTFPTLVFCFEDAPLGHRVDTKKTGSLLRNAHMTFLIAAGQTKLS